VEVPVTTVRLHSTGSSQRLRYSAEGLGGNLWCRFICPVAVPWTEPLIHALATQSSR
jgi:hypothetical protein